MKHYLWQRLLLLPITLFAIILINFIILNLAPFDPASGGGRSSLDEASRKADDGFQGEEQFLLFRQHYGLTLPILFNTWPTLSIKKLREGLNEIVAVKNSSASEFHRLHTLWGDRAPFLMRPLLQIAQERDQPKEIRILALNLFIRGGTRHGWVGPTLDEEQKEENRSIAKANSFLLGLKAKQNDSEEAIEAKISRLKAWHEENRHLFPFTYSLGQKAKIFFTKTRFFQYMRRILTLDFGTLRSDQNKYVVDEVFQKIKYSLTLSVTPMLFTFVGAAFFGICMAFFKNRLVDISLNTFFLVLFSIPTFVAAPFLIEKVAISHNLPYGGFHSEEKIYQTLTSSERLKDTLVHLILPLTCVMYGMMAVQARLSRTAILHVFRQDHVKTAYAKGLRLPTLLWRHVGKNAAIPMVTSLASSLGLILGGSLVVETIFEINGFGRFFYDAVINRDYNVVLFSAFAGSFLTLLGYLLADICYTLLDPRIRFS